jgi:predicted DNA-binding transcriptional regulator AlpA
MVSSMPKSRTESAAVSPTPRLALSIPEFCKAHGISEGFFYKLKKQGESPREMKVGARTLITFEAAADWRAEREAVGTATPEKARAKREQAA